MHHINAYSYLVRCANNAHCAGFVSSQVSRRSVRVRPARTAASKFGCVVLCCVAMPTSKKRRLEASDGTPGMACLSTWHVYCLLASGVLKNASEEHLLELQDCLKEAAGDLNVPDLFDVMPRDA